MQFISFLQTKYRQEIEFNQTRKIPSGIFFLSQLSRFSVNPHLNEFVAHHFFFQLLLEEDNEYF